MTSLLRSLISNPLVRAQVVAGLRHLLTMGGTALVAIINAHVLPIAPDASAAIVGDVVGIGMALAAQYLAQSDVKGVDAKMQAALAAPPSTPMAAINSLKSAP